jgi:hypothetical protein
MSWLQGAGSREQGAGSREQGAGSRPISAFYDFFGDKNIILVFKQLLIRALYCKPLRN